MKAKTTKPAAQPATRQSATPAAMTQPALETSMPIKSPETKNAKAVSAKATRRDVSASGTESKSSTAAKAVKTRAKKPKLVRDSFTMPDNEYAVIADIKQACLQAGFEIKKSQLLRIGISLVKALDTAGLRERADALTPLKPGRPKAS